MKSVRVLIVSENKATAVVASSIVERLGCLVERSTLAGAAQQVAFFEPDMIVVDSDCKPAIAMAGNNRSVRPKIALLTNDASIGDDLNADEIVAKPVRQGTLEAALLRLVSAIMAIDNEPSA